MVTLAVVLYGADHFCLSQSTRSSKAYCDSNIYVTATQVNYLVPRYRVCEKSWERGRLARPRRRWERGRLVRPGVRGDERVTGGDAPALRGWLAHAYGRRDGRDVRAPSGRCRLFTDLVPR